MRLTTWLMGLLAWLGGQGVVAQEVDPQATLNQAEAAFQEGIKRRAEPGSSRKHFAESARHLADLYRAGRGDARSLLQQGDAELLADLLPQAIISYHRGLRLAPNNGTLRDNLEVARGLVSHLPATDLARPPLDSWPPGLPRPTAGWLLALAWLGYALTLAAATRWLMTRHRAWLLRTFALGLCTLLAGAGWLWQGSCQRWQEQQPLVVIAADAVTLFRGNSDSYPRHPDLPTLSRGLEARRLSQRGDWLQIQFASGTSGWVHKQQVLVDEP